MNKPPVEHRVGGVVFRKGFHLHPEYLFVTSNSHPAKWIFPAGHVEPGETDEEAATREVLEESGVAAVIIEELGRYQYFWSRSDRRVTIETRLFLMDYRETLCVNAENRRVDFFSYEDSLKLNLWDESRLILSKAHQRVMEILN